MSSKETGKLGEDIACRYLERKGYIITERNYWKKWGEIDIVASKGNTIHFVEVKSVSRENIGYVSTEHNTYRAEDNMHPWKMQRLSRVIKTYLLDKAVSDETNWQFDVITVQIDHKNLITRVELIENVIL
jgi:putative endonuclease